MGVHDNINKCALPASGTTPAGHTVKSLLQSGVERVVAVVGYAQNSVIDALSEFADSGRVVFTENPQYERHGCNFSLACGINSEYVSSAEKLIIAEGDSLLRYESIKKLADIDSEAASLVRNVSYVDYFKSVVAIGTGGEISNYFYDTLHSGLPPEMPDGEEIIGESMQLWSFSGGVLAKLKQLLREYGDSADMSQTAFTHSGVYSINQLNAPIQAVFSDYPNDWINLNTQNDLKKAEETKWLIK
jgi:hypothetical protein